MFFHCTLSWSGRPPCCFVPESSCHNTLQLLLNGARVHIICRGMTHVLCFSGPKPCSLVTMSANCLMNNNNNSSYSSYCCCYFYYVCYYQQQYFTHWCKKSATLSCMCLKLRSLLAMYSKYCYSNFVHCNQRDRKEAQLY